MRKRLTLCCRLTGSRDGGSSRRLFRYAKLALVASERSFAPLVPLPSLPLRLQRIAFDVTCLHLQKEVAHQHRLCSLWHYGLSEAGKDERWRRDSVWAHSHPFPFASQQGIGCSEARPSGLDLTPVGAMHRQLLHSLWTAQKKLVR